MRLFDITSALKCLSKGMRMCAEYGHTGDVLPLEIWRFLNKIDKKLFYVKTVDTNYDGNAYYTGINI